MRPDQIRAIEGRDVAGLTVEHLNILNSAQLAVLTGGQMVAFSSDQIGAIDPAHIRGLSTSAIRSIQVADMPGLTTAQIEAMTSVQVAAFSSPQVQALSQEQTQAYLIAKTPLVLDLNGDGIQTIASANGVVFDVDNDGQSEQVGWTSTADGLLVRDLNGDGQINDGGELFGEGTALADGSKAKDGYVALRALDSNLDGLINDKDAKFGELMVWQDANSDGKTDKGELRSLAERNIHSLSLHAEQSQEISNGNLIGLMGSYTTTDGATHTMGDVWFSVEPSGQKVFDLANIVKHSELPAVSAPNVSNHAMSVSLQDVLSPTQDAHIHLPAADAVSESIVNLENTGGINNLTEDYSVHVNQESQLLHNQRLNNVII
jgi:hypothetical protein